MDSVRKEPGRHPGREGNVYAQRVFKKSAAASHQKVTIINGTAENRGNQYARQPAGLFSDDFSPPLGLQSRGNDKNPAPPFF